MGLSGLQSLITDIESQPGWQARRQFSQVVDYWPKAVGYVVARQTKPASIQRHVLYVTVANASWVQTLTLERRRVLHQLNRLLALPLEDIRFSSAKWHDKPVRITQPDSDWVKNHPSYMGPTGAPRQAKIQGTAAPDQAKTPEEAYALWVTRKKMQQKSQETCPECQCACPPGEIARWTMCALCIVKTWK
ncbi:DUF721 domain-containing protein [Leptothoe sp. PORK10 BA2]|uniref:DUF721 domain-containing protein n=1 Tax=Leptothoe sp. PORK10 BA2 TaxID=3110254 RepID=UPI002B1FEFB3|nr:DUF721 domain-containing protein [Leptothoe sp. PORK10 BA2]MEA5465086.1 DUF721 domain-containing protein [Leptothoe sp. PORK10 BA2]